jgi:hypothetical protein
MCSCEGDSGCFKNMQNLPKGTGFFEGDKFFECGCHRLLVRLEFEARADAERRQCPDSSSGAHLKSEGKQTDVLCTNPERKVTPRA